MDDSPSCGQDEVHYCITGWPWETKGHERAYSSHHCVMRRLSLHLLRHIDCPYLAEQYSVLGRSVCLWKPCKILFQALWVLSRGKLFILMHKGGLLTRQNATDICQCTKAGKFANIHLTQDHFPIYKQNFGIASPFGKSIFRFVCGCKLFSDGPCRCSHLRSKYPGANLSTHWNFERCFCVEDFDQQTCPEKLRSNSMKSWIAIPNIIVVTRVAVIKQYLLSKA